MTNSDQTPRLLTVNLKEKKGRYYAVFKYADRNGHPKERWFTLKLAAKPENKRKALSKMEEMRYALRGTMDVPGYEIPFTKYMQDWAVTKESEVENNTYKKLCSCVKNKIIPFFSMKRLALSEVKAKHIKALYEHLYLNGREDGTGGLSISTLKSIKSILNEAFKDAVVEELIQSNPVESVKLPTKSIPRKEYTVLDQESANRLLGYVSEDPLMYPLLLLTLRYGLRKSEVLGLKWTAVDFEHNVLRIESVIVQGEHAEKDRTKTQTSRASFPLFPEIKEALMLRRQDQQRYLEIGMEQPIYVFTKPDGTHLNPCRVTEEFRNILISCGLPRMRFHDLRHSAACILYENGLGVKEIQQWMRHGKLQMTADVYLHVSKKREKELTEDLVDMLAPSYGSASNEHLIDCSKIRNA